MKPKSMKQPFDFEELIDHLRVFFQECPFGKIEMDVYNHRAVNVRLLESFDMSGKRNSAKGKQK